MTAPRSIILISCVKSKSSRRAKAKDLYDSTLFRAQRAYAERFGDQWFILSAKYGLLDPEREIDPYEETLKGDSTKQKRDWSECVYNELQRHTRPHDIITITAGEDYCRYLEPLLAERGNLVIRPVKGLSMGFIPGRLRELIASAPHQTSVPIVDVRSAPTDQPEKLDFHSSAETNRGTTHLVDSQIEKFYSILARLQETTRGMRLLKDLTPAEVPHRGVYFFFQNGELRADGRTPRVVRVGTHGLKPGSKSTLYNRLMQYRGSSTGGGNHRSSVFRLHVGKALISRGLFGCPSWAQGSNAPREVVLAERDLEQAVSQYIGDMYVLLLDIPDEPGPASDRALIERNAIGLLAGGDAPSKDWLGLSTNNPAILRSGLWNVNHVDHNSDDNFFDRFRTTCIQTTEFLIGKNRDASGGLLVLREMAKGREGTSQVPGKCARN